MSSLRSLAFTILLAGCGQSDVVATMIEAGVASVEITPAEPIRLSGYRTRREPASEVAGKLWAKALALGGADEPAVLITADLIGVPRALTDRVAERLELSRERLAVCATHTHSGPFVRGVLPNIFGEPIPDDHAAVIADYAVELEDKLVAVATNALASRKPSRISWSTGEAGFAQNRRVAYLLRQLGKSAKPPAPIDHELPALFVRGADGELRAVLLNYACHCTSMQGGFNSFHGDWAGVAARLIQERRPGVTALVAVGCGADQNPQPRGSLENAEAHGAEIADEIDRLLGEESHSLTSAPRCRYGYAELPFATVSDDALARRLNSKDQRVRYYAQILTDRKAQGIEPPASLEYPVQTWVFGKDLAMVFLAGEVVVDYSLRLKRELGPGRVWVNGYSNDAPCYIASARVIGEGGYEVVQSMDSYDKPTQLNPAAEERIIEMVHELLPDEFETASD